MSNNNLSLRNKIKKSIKETLEGSSLHGIPNIAKSDFILLKMIWLICLLSSVGVLGWFLSKTISDYLTLPTTTNIEINYVHSLTFPIVTLCSLNGFSSLDNVLNNNCQTNNPTCCSFDQNHCTQYDDFEPVIDPYYGNCLRFNSGKNWNGTKIPLKSASKGTTFYNALELQISKGREENLNFGNEHGLIVFISNETINSNINTGIKLSTGTSTDIKLTRYTIIKQPQPYSVCLNDLTSSKSYDSECFRKTLEKSKSGIYHYTHCQNMCLGKLLGDRCNYQTDIAGGVYYDNMTFYSITGIRYLLDLGQFALFQKLYSCARKTVLEFSKTSNYSEACDCPIECQTTGFSYSISSSQFPKENTTLTDYNNHLSSLPGFNVTYPDFDSYYNSLKQDTLYLKIYFEESTETIISEVPKYQLADLISNLGGTIGLFTGFSFLSLIEIVEILINIGFIVYKNKRNKKIEPEVDVIENMNLKEIEKMKVEIENLKKLVMNKDHEQNKIDQINEILRSKHTKRH